MTYSNGADVFAQRTLGPGTATGSPPANPGIHTPPPWRLLVTEVGDGAFLPKRAYHDDAGLDLAASVRTVCWAGQFTDIPTALAVQMPSSVWGLITGRSSTIRSRGLLVVSGVIDPGYRGELFVGVWNLGPSKVVVAEGDRLGQLILINNVTAQTEIERVDALEDHPRGLNGMGSSGR